jgi:peptidoglycan/xylan/chitin deacetylase (PgdA/CDA1 family)
MSAIKRVMRRIAATAYYHSPLCLQELQGKVVILAYHRVLPARDIQQQYIQPGMYVLEDVFDTQMRFVSERFEILSLDAILSRWNTKNWSPLKAYCAITFDDGWHDNYQYAYPILKRYGIPATVFLTTDFIGTRRWFWPERLGFLLAQYYERHVTADQLAALRSLWNQFGLRQDSLIKSDGSPARTLVCERLDRAIEACKELQQSAIERLIQESQNILEVETPETRLLMNWEEASEMSQDNFTFGSHSCTHRIMTRLSHEEAKAELVQSREALLRNQVKYTPVFCYPNGNYSASLQTLAREAGYSAAVSYRFGCENGSPLDLFALRRIGIHNDVSETPSLFSLHLSGLLHQT